MIADTRCPLVIVGAGGFGRETAEAVRALNSIDGSWHLVGYLDDDATRHGTVIDGLPVLGGIAELEDMPDFSVVVTTGRPDNYMSRPQIVRNLAISIERYATIIHPAASVSSTSCVGAGSVVLAHAVLTAGVSVGAHVAVMPHVTLTHEDIVEDFATLASGVHLGGGVRVCQGAYLGAGALIRESCTVGRCSLVGMGAVVLRDVPACEVWVGVPARYSRGVEFPS